MHDKSTKNDNTITRIFTAQMHNNSYLRLEIAYNQPSITHNQPHLQTTTTTFQNHSTVVAQRRVKMLIISPKSAVLLNTNTLATCQ